MAKTPKKPAAKPAAKANGKAKAASKTAVKKIAKAKTTKPAANKAAKTSKTSPSAKNSPPNKLDPKVIEQITAVRSQVRQNFGTVIMSMMMMPRYRHQTLGDLQSLVLEPMLRDRIAIAYPGGTKKDELTDLTGMAIWASVSDEVDAKIRDQISAGTFPIRLTPDDWTSGTNNWLLDVIAPDQKTAAAVISNFKQLIKEGSLKLHPLVTRLVDKDALEKMGAEKMGTGTENA